MNSIHSKTRKTFWYQNSWPKTIIFLLRCLKFPNAQICFGNDYLRSVMQLGNGLISWSYNGSQYGAPPVGSFLHSITIYLFVLFSFGSPGADTFLNLSIVAGKLAYSVRKYFKLLKRLAAVLFYHNVYNIQYGNYLLNQVCLG